MAETTMQLNQKHPVNQAALNALGKVKEVATDNQVYSIQLVNWALENGHLKPRNSRLAELTEIMEAEWSPKGVMSAISSTEDGARVDVLPDKLEALEPVELAKAILEAIHLYWIENEQTYSEPIPRLPG